MIGGPDRPIFGVTPPVEPRANADRPSYGRVLRNVLPFVAVALGGAALVYADSISRRITKIDHTLAVAPGIRTATVTGTPTSEPTPRPAATPISAAEKTATAAINATVINSSDYKAALAQADVQRIAFETRVAKEDLGRYSVARTAEAKVVATVNAAETAQARTATATATRTVTLTPFSTRLPDGTTVTATLTSTATRTATGTPSPTGSAIASKTAESVQVTPPATTSPLPVRALG